MPVVVLAVPFDNAIFELSGDITSSATTASVIANTKIPAGATKIYAEIIKADTVGNKGACEAEIKEPITITNVGGTGDVDFTITRDPTSPLVFSKNDVLRVGFRAQWLTDIHDALTKGDDELNLGAITVNGDLDLGASGVNKLWRHMLLVGETGIYTASASGAVESFQIFSTNRREINVLAFRGAASEVDRATGLFIWPDDYDGRALIADVYWTGPNAGSGAVRWTVQIGADQDGQDLMESTAFGSNNVVDTYQGSKILHRATVNLTISDWVAGDTFAPVHIVRDSSHGSDTYADTAWLMGINIHY